MAHAYLGVDYPSHGCLGDADHDQYHSKDQDNIQPAKICTLESRAGDIPVRYLDKAKIKYAEERGRRSRDGVGGWMLGGTILGITSAVRPIIVQYVRPTGRRTNRSVSTLFLLVHPSCIVT